VKGGGRRAQIRRKGGQVSSFLSCKANSRGELFDRAAAAAAAASSAAAKQQRTKTTTKQVVTKITHTQQEI